MSKRHPEYPDVILTLCRVGSIKQLGFSSLHVALQRVGEGEIVPRRNHSWIQGQRALTRGLCGAAVTFLKRHLGGKHKVGVDRVTMTEEGEELAVLDYPEGGLPISAKKLPKGLREGSRLQYDPRSGKYSKL